MIETDGDSTWSRLAIVTVILCFVLNMVDGTDVMIVSFLAPALQREFGTSTTGLSIVFSMGLAGMALGGLGLAPLADRVGRRRMIMVALVVMSLATFASSQARSIGEFAAARFVVGSGIGTVLACIAAIAARIAPPRHRNFAVGVLQAGYPIGGVITAFATAALLPTFGWRVVLLGAAGVSLLMLPLCLAVLPRTDVSPGGSHATLTETLGGPRRRSSLLLWVSTICSFMALYFIASWITKLAISAGLPETQAIVASAFYGLGSFVGTVAMSVAATRMNVRIIASVLLISAAGVFLIFGGVALSLYGVLVTAFAMGITLQGGFNALYPVAAQVYPDSVRATGIGWAMGVGRIGAFLGPLIGGVALGQQLPLIVVFGLFGVPLLIAAVAVRFVVFETDPDRSRRPGAA